MNAPSASPRGRQRAAHGEAAPAPAPRRATLARFVCGPAREGYCWAAAATPWLLGLALTAVVLLSGCANDPEWGRSGTPKLDARHGDAARTLRAQQTQDPQAAARNAERSSPTDGRLVRAAADRVVEGQRAPAQSTVGPSGSGGAGN